jgi:hypothetical protein
VPVHDQFWAGDAFEVEANASFKVKADVDAAYFCTYE